MKAITTQHIKRPLQPRVEQLPRTAARAMRPTQSQQHKEAGLCTLGQSIGHGIYNERHEIKKLLAGGDVRSHTGLINPICCSPLSANFYFSANSRAKILGFPLNFLGGIFKDISDQSEAEQDGRRRRRRREWGGAVLCWLIFVGLDWFRSPPTRKRCSPSKRINTNNTPPKPLLPPSFLLPFASHQRPGVRCIMCNHCLIKG